MIKNQATQDNCDDGLEIPSLNFSLAESSQAHPYQYLKCLNKIFNTCNKSSGKDYSSASKVKLPWKKFKTVAIPKCFEQNYNIQKKQINVLKGTDDKINSGQVQKEKKFWKDHQDLMKKYYMNSKANKSIKKQKIQERKRNLFSANSLSISKENQSSFFLKKAALRSFAQYQGNKENKDNNEQFCMIKTQFDQIKANGTCFGESYYPFTKTYNNPLTSNHLKKNIKLEKNASESMTVEEEVLLKLKKIQLMPHVNRAKTANMLSRQGKIYKQRQKLEARLKKTVCQQILKESRVQDGEYLEYNLKQELIERYKKKIKQIDCSISDKNVKKTAEILKKMHNLANIDVEDYCKRIQFREN